MYKRGVPRSAFRVPTGSSKELEFFNLSVLIIKFIYKRDMGCRTMWNRERGTPIPYIKHIILLPSNAFLFGIYFLLFEGLSHDLLNNTLLTYLDHRDISV